jgi:ubiquinone/menaquinone biosynthesis C-methylase UbiE
MTRRTGDGADKAWLADVFDRAAATYDEPGGGYHDRFGERLVRAAGVQAGDRVLDVACGRGAVLAPAARVAGGDGRVLGVDLSPEMVRLAAERLAGEGLDVETAVMDAETLDLPDRSFDVVLCAFGVFFLPDPERAAAELRRVLVPTGTVAVSTWGADDPRWAWEDELLADVAVERRAVRRPFDQPAALEALLRGAGFDDVHVEPSHLEVRFGDADEWWAWKWSYSFRGILEQLPDERVARLRRDARQRLDEMARGDGLLLRLEALFAVGRR